MLKFIKYLPVLDYRQQKNLKKPKVKVQKNHQKLKNQLYRKIQKKNIQIVLLIWKLLNQNVN